MKAQDGCDIHVGASEVDGCVTLKLAEAYCGFGYSQAVTVMSAAEAAALGNQLLHAAQTAAKAIT